MWKYSTYVYDTYGIKIKHFYLSSVSVCATQVDMIINTSREIACMNMHRTRMHIWRGVALSLSVSLSLSHFGIH